MNGSTAVRGEMEVDTWGCFTTHHQMKTRTQILGELTLPAFDRGGTFLFADGRELVVGKTSWWKGWHELRENGIVVGSARPLGFWAQRIGVGFRGRMYELVSAGFWSDGWDLLDESGMKILEIRRRGFFRRMVDLLAHEEILPDLLVFAYYLAHVRWQEQTAVVATTAAAS